MDEVEWMNVMNDKIRDSLKFVINELKKICLNKNFVNGIILSEVISYNLENGNISSAGQISKIISSIFNLIDDLKFLIEIETRYILFPLPDIKKEAYEMGKKYMKNFLEWVKPEDSPEKLIGILEKENYKLEEVKEILMKLESG